MTRIFFFCVFWLIAVIDPSTVLAAILVGGQTNLVARQRAPESLMIKRRTLLPSFNFRFVQEQESISIAKKDKTLIKVSDLFSLGEKPFILCVLWEYWDRFLRT